MAGRKELFPVWLDLSGKKVVVIGIRNEMLQTIIVLGRCCGNVILIPDPDTEVSGMKGIPEDVRINMKTYERNDLLDADLVLCGTKMQKTAEDVSAACRCLGIPVYLYGDASKSSFYLKAEENEG